MKLSFIIISFLTSLFLSTQPKDIYPNNSLTLKATVIKYKLDTLRIQTILTNNTSDTIRSVSMSCSWWEFFLFNQKNIALRSGRCDSNIPTIIEIPPDSNHVRILELKIRNSLALQSDKNFKIAYKHIPIKSNNYYALDFFDLIDQPIDSTKLIWSNSIQIK